MNENRMNEISSCTFQPNTLVKRKEPSRERNVFEELHQNVITPRRA